MNSGQQNSLGVYGAYAIVAFFGVLGSVIIALITNVNLIRMTYISDLAFISASVMASVPAVMAGVIASFIHHTHVATLPNAVASTGTDVSEKSP